MRFARWITKATNIRSEYVILIAFPRQKWLRERATILVRILPVLFFITQAYLTVHKGRFARYTYHSTVRETEEYQFYSR